MFISNNRAKSLKILWKLLSAKFYFLHFMTLLTAKSVKNSHIKAIIYFIFLKNVLKQIWNAFNTKFQAQWKDRKRSYRVRQLFALFCNLIALTLGQNSVKGLRVTKIVKEFNFEGAWDELESKKVSRDNQSQSICDYRYHVK